MPTIRNEGIGSSNLMLGFEDVRKFKILEQHHVVMVNILKERFHKS